MTSLKTTNQREKQPCPCRARAACALAWSRASLAGNVSLSRRHQVPRLRRRGRRCWACPSGLGACRDRFEDRRGLGISAGGALRSADWRCDHPCASGPVSIAIMIGAIVLVHWGQWRQTRLPRRTRFGGHGIPEPCCWLSRAFLPAARQQGLHRRTLGNRAAACKPIGGPFCDHRRKNSVTQSLHLRRYDPRHVGIDAVGAVTSPEKGH